MIPEIITYSTPTRPSANFEGREVELEEIKKFSKEKVILISGLGGIGKTEICRNIFWNYVDNGTEQIKYIGWISCTNGRKSFEGEFLALNDVKNKLEEIKPYINRLGNDLLLFLDNANELSKEDKEWITSLHCRMIITSRIKINNVELYPIDKMPMDRCTVLYRKSREEDNISEENFNDKEIVEEIITLADCHTQAVELLAKTERAAYLKSAELLETLKNEGFALNSIEETVEGTHFEKTVEERFITHIEKIFDISQISEGSQVRILKMFSFLAPNIPVEAQTLKKWFELRNFNDVKELVKRGWINEDTDKRLFMHPVISGMIKNKYLKDEDFSKQLLNNLKEALKESEGKDYKYINNLLQHSEAVIKNYPEKTEEEYGVFLIEAGKVYINAGIYTEANEKLQKALSIFKEENVTDTASAYTYLGKSCIWDGKYEEAIKHLNKAKEFLEGIDNKDSYIADTYNYIGLYYYHIGEYTEALSYYIKSKEIREEVLGENHSETATTYNNIAGLYQAQGEYSTALEYYNKALAIVEKVLGTEHPDTATTYDNIAQVYRAQGDYSTSMEYYNKALDIYEKVLGTEHPDTATTYNNIALSYQAQGDYSKAMEYYKKSVTISEKALGTEHPSTATTYHNIATLLYAQRKYQDSLTYITKAYKIFLIKFGKKHPDTMEVKNTVQGIAAACHRDGNIIIKRIEKGNKK